jgi:flagellar hook-length control protein FliK
MNTGLSAKLLACATGVLGPSGPVPRRNASLSVAAKSEKVVPGNTAKMLKADNSPTDSQKTAQKKTRAGFQIVLNERQIGPVPAQKGSTDAGQRTKVSAADTMLAKGPVPTVPPVQLPAKTASEVLSSKISTSGVPRPQPAAAPAESAQLPGRSPKLGLPPLLARKIRQGSARPVRAASKDSTLPSKPAQLNSDASRTLPTTLPANLSEKPPMLGAARQSVSNSDPTHRPNGPSGRTATPARQSTPGELIPDPSPQAARAVAEAAAPGNQTFAAAVNPLSANSMVGEIRSPDSKPQLPSLGPKKSSPQALEVLSGKSRTDKKSFLQSQSSDANRQGPLVPQEAGKSVPQKPQNLDVRVMTGHKETGGLAAAKSAPESDQQRKTSLIDPHHPAEWKPSVPATLAKNANTTSTGTAHATISRQIQESVSGAVRRGDQQITVQLSPPELGKVSIRFRERDGQISGSLQVSRTQTRAEIQQVLPQILRTLQDSGVQVKRLEVLLTNDQNQPGFKDQALPGQQDGGSAHQGPATPDEHGTNQSLDNWLLAGEQAALMAPDGALVTGESINMLA